MVSLVPSVTETLLAWGVQPVACTRFCDQPQLRHVGGTKDPDVGAISALRPDLVVLDCEENRLQDHDALVAAGVPVHVTTVRSFGDLDTELQALADAVGRRWRPAGQLVPAAASGPVSARRAAPVRRRAFVPIWRRPYMALGEPTYGSSLLAELGVANVYAGDGPYPTVTLAEAAGRRPDVVLAPSEPYPFSTRQQAELESVAPVVFVDGRDLFWWGVRTPAALDRLAGQLAGAAGRG